MGRLVASRSTPRSSEEKGWKTQPPLRMVVEKRRVCRAVLLYMFAYVVFVCACVHVNVWTEVGLTVVSVARPVVQTGLNRSFWFC